MLYRNSFLLRSILGIAVTACQQNTMPKKDMVHSTRDSPINTSRLEETITQKKQQLEQAKLELTQIQTRLTNLSQHYDESQSDIMSIRTREGSPNEQYVPVQTLEEVAHENNAMYESDNTSIQFPLSILTGSSDMSEIFKEGSNDDLFLSLEEHFEQADNRLATSLEAFLEETSDSKNAYLQSTTSDGPELESAKQYYDSAYAQQNLVSIQPFSDTLLEDPLQAPNMAEISDDTLMHSSQTSSLSSRDITALQADANSLGKRIVQLEQELDELEAGLREK